MKRLYPEAASEVRMNYPKTLLKNEPCLLQYK
jgi:hypothetical protein